MGDMLAEIEGLERPARLLGIFAHPDDEIFCAGGLFAEMSGRGADIRVVSYTTGDAGQIRDAEVATRATLGQVRRTELFEAAAELGITDIVVHDRGDGTLSGQPEDELLDIARDTINEHRPDIIITFGPDGAYGHPDHIRISEIATEAGRAIGVPVYHAAFPRQPQRLIDLLVEWLAGSDTWHRGTPEFAHGLMLFADGSSMLGFASDHMDVGFYPPGTFIIEQGEPADKLYLILSGSVEVAQEAADGTLRHLDRASAGTFFGEIGLARNSPRSAHVIAETSTTCFILAPGAPSMAAGRGTGSEVSATVDPSATEQVGAEFELDLSDHAAAKMRALARHRSQYALTADMFPDTIVEALFGVERFNRARG
jgi:LmbE family N-acetylglucosaminyl deacetylase